MSDPDSESPNGGDRGLRSSPNGDPDDTGPTPNGTGSSENDADGISNPLATVLGGARWILVGRILKLIGNFSVQILIARLLGTASFGGVSLAKNVSRVGSLIGGLGISRGVVRNAPYYEDEPAKYRGTVRAALLLGGIGGVVAAAVIGISAPWIASELFGDPDITVLLQIGALGIPISILSGIVVAITKGARDASTHTIVNQILRPLSESVLVAALVLLGFGAVGAITGGVIATVLTAGIAIYLMIRVMPVSLIGDAVRMHRDLLAFSLPLFLSAGMSFLVASADTILLGVFRTSSEVGIYNAAFTLRTIPLLFFFPATFLLSPVLTRLQKENRDSEARQTYQAISKWTTLVSLPLVCLGLFFPEVVVRTVFGSAYSSGEEAFRIIMASALGTLIFGANDRAVVGLGHNKVSMWVTAGAGVLNIILNVLLIPSFGIVGAALASTVAFVARNVVNSALLYRWHGLTPFSAGLLRVLGILTLISPVGYLAFTTVFDVNLVNIAALGTLFLVIYSALTLRVAAFEQIDYEMIDEIEKVKEVDLAPVLSVLEQISGGGNGRYADRYRD